MTETVVPGIADRDVDEPDPLMVRGFNKQFITGVTVVTTREGDKPRGLAVNAYASISFDPPLIMVCIQRTSSTYPALHAATHLGVNILSNRQREVVNVFSSKSDDKFAEFDWHGGPHGSPLIDGSAAMLEAEIRERFQAKTHTVFICRVRHAEVNDVAPMAYKAGKILDGGGLTEIPER
ncbi:flavin reductase family protein [Arthrobacter sp. SDTb3-6]|uniref:flavin reductase family protein n=1 Tax=Arthrobacter sp. SDTb3-6 TaxID=2713571 RepID=UPI00159D89B2|nr:flavin reductase family protein [Arthrobacter sp. SDTb3-6]NVM98231.1 flavin reductase family protein [Arthrobacter sp. SDTb3-6]